MRELSVLEIASVAAGGDQCTPENTSGYGGFNESAWPGQDLTYVYTALVAATSSLIESVAKLLE